MDLRRATATTITMGPATNSAGTGVENVPNSTTPTGTTANSATAGCTVYKNGTAVAYSPTLVQAGNGIQRVALDTSITDTVGRFEIVIVDSVLGVLYAAFDVLHENIWDQKYGSVATLTDKNGYTLSAPGVAAIWDALTSGMSTVGSIGKKLKDWVLGADNKAILSSDAHTGARIPVVTLVDTATTLTNKSGFELASTGLNAITITATAGAATTFPQMVVHTYLREHGHLVKDHTDKTITLYADAGTSTVLYSQTYTDDGVGNESLLLIS